MDKLVEINMERIDYGVERSRVAANSCMAGGVPTHDGISWLAHRGDLPKVEILGPQWHILGRIWNNRPGMSPCASVKHPPRTSRDTED